MVGARRAVPGAGRQARHAVPLGGFILYLFLRRASWQNECG